MKLIRQVHGINFVLNFRKGMKTLKMTYDKDGTLIVRSPYYISRSTIDSFVLSNKQWIENHKPKEIFQQNTEQNKLPSKVPYNG
ncbi:MAG: hypothetical protein HUK24_02430, partial [Sphaerochaetaceae bacterium]|nr:hypothetical protein [Sphaerochaetaceae bacterium]